MNPSHLSPLLTTAEPLLSGAACRALAGVARPGAIDQFINYWEINSSNRNSAVAAEKRVFHVFPLKTRLFTPGTLRELEGCGAAMGAVPQ